MEGGRVLIYVFLCISGDFPWGRLEHVLELSSLGRAQLWINKVKVKFSDDDDDRYESRVGPQGLEPVSYTHLTLPTICSV